MKEVVERSIEKEKGKETRQLLNNLERGLAGLVGSRKRRSLLPFVGKILNGLFGVAQESDLEKEEERLTKIEAWAQKYVHVITEVICKFNNHSQAFIDATEDLLEIE